MESRPWGVANVRGWNNVDIWDTFNDPFVNGLEKQRVDQHVVNDHLFTAILSLNAKMDQINQLLASR